ncbi:MAG: AAA family ATPase [Candidatus Cloacimonetes bacterium]|nr:AAA family ATPase [Candidatus Cloacimonadota bacterium]
MRYVDKILTLPPMEADNALLIGQALHTGIQKSVDTAINEYFMSYPVIDDNHINEAMKLEYLIPRAAAMLPPGEYEVPILSSHHIGYIDLLSKNEDGTYDLYDFKYSNNVKNYKNSVQLHLYKYFWEKQNPGKIIKNTYFLFVPKVQIKQKKTEDLLQFRRRIQSELNEVEPKIVPIEFDMEKIVEFMFGIKDLLEEKDFKKNPSYLCRYCEYQDYCERGVDYMLLPKNERRNIEKIEKKVIWLYGSPFSGKTTFANKFPDPLMLNTDGNIKFADAPYVPIKDQVTVEGRMTKRKLAWETFKEVIAELEKKDNQFKTISVDLLEDTYESCRLYMYDQMGITHESDDSFRAWDKVRTEFLSTLKKLMNLEYENIILISHEDTSKDITKKGGDKITAIKPNLQEKTSNKVAGMVDIVARVVADGEVRVLSFKTNEVIFGGGRLAASTNEIPLDYDAFLSVYEEANRNAVKKLKKENTCSDKGGTIEESTVTEKGTEKKKGRTKKETSTTPKEVPNDENMTSDSTSEPVEQETPATELENVTENTEIIEESAPSNEEPTTKRTVVREKGGRARVVEVPVDESIKEEVVPVDEVAKTRTRKKRGE